MLQLLSFLLLCLSFAERSQLKGRATNDLASMQFSFFDLGEIMPSGWLQSQIKIQANGMSGYLDEYWSDVSESGWIGGWAEGWERFPYFLDGVVGLSVLSENQKMLNKVTTHFKTILGNQTKEGWFGPEQGKGNLGKGDLPKFDPWPQFAILKAMIQWHSYTKDKSLLEKMILNVKKVDEIITKNGLDGYVWAKSRVMDFLYVLEYLYDVTKDQNIYQILIKNAQKGFDWEYHFNKNFSNFREKQTSPFDYLRVHGVNNAQAIKLPAILMRIDGNLWERKGEFGDWVSKLQEYHGSATGIFHGDEWYSGLSPTQGTELCLIVEALFSLEIAQHTFGDTWMGDLIEEITFNNLPAILDFEMETHQYVSMDNQVMTMVPSKTNFTCVSPSGSLFGVAPTYGCCTANFPQGWPKFTQSIFGKFRDNNGIGVLEYAPAKLKAKVGNISIDANLITDYPFNDGKIKFVVNSISKTPDIFHICFRIPNWAQQEVPIYLNGEYFEKGVSAKNKCISRIWNNGDVIEFTLPMNIRKSSYSFHNSISVLRGPLLLSRQIKSQKTLIHQCPVPIKKTECEDYYDYESEPIENWNYGLKIDKEDITKSFTLEMNPSFDSTKPFKDDNPAFVVSVNEAYEIEWNLNKQFLIAEEVPNSPVKPKTSQSQKLDLIPYGNTRLRISVFPTVN